AVGIPYARLIGEEKLGFPTVNVTANFNKRIKYGEKVRITVAVARIGKSSVQFQYQGLNPSSGEVYFNAIITNVAVNMDNFATMALTEKFVEIFSRFQP